MTRTALILETKMFGKSKRLEEKMSELLQTWGLRKEEKSPKIPAETKDFLLSQDGTVCEFWKAKLFGTSKRSE